MEHSGAVCSLLTSWLAARYLITQLLDIMGFFAGSIFIYELRPSCTKLLGLFSWKGKGQGLSPECDFCMHWDWFIYHFPLLLPAGTSAVSRCGGKSIRHWGAECRTTQGVSKPCSGGGQEPTGTADTVGVANWKAGAVGSPRRCTESIYLLGNFQCQAS